MHPQFLLSCGVPARLMYGNDSSATFIVLNVLTQCKCFPVTVDEFSKKSTFLHMHKDFVDKNSYQSLKIHQQKKNLHTNQADIKSLFL